MSARNLISKHNIYAMKKSIFMIALLAVSLIASSGYTDTVTGTQPGKYAPQLALEQGDDTLSLGQCRGEYVLITFWSSSDAVSRQACNRYSAWMAKHPESAVRHLAVNFDADRALFEEIVAVDGLDATAQYNVQGNAARRIIRDYRLDGGYGSVLINPDGRIAELDPPLTQLSSLR